MYEKLFPPKNGGMLRCWNLVNQLSKYFDLDVITLQNDIEKKLRESGYAISETTRFIIPRQRNAPKKNQHFFIQKVFSAIKYRWFYRTLSSADANFLKIIPVIKSIAGNAYDVVIFEHLESIVLWKKIKHLFPGAIIIFV